MTERIATTHGVHAVTVPATGVVEPDATAHIVYVVEYPLTTRDIERFGLGFMHESGYWVTILDVGEITQPNVLQNRDHYGEFTDFDITVIRQRAELDGARALLEQADVIFPLMGAAGLTLRNIPVFRLISRSRRPYVMLSTNAFPGWNKYRGEPGLRSRVLRIANILSRLGEIKWAHSILARMPPAWLGIRPADFIVRGGEQSVLPHQLITSETRRIDAHSMDYETFRNLPEAAGEAEDTAVFIDEYMSYHPDLDQIGTRYSFSPEEYYGSLRALFDRIEGELGLEVVIAACPHADYSDKPGLFGNRSIIDGQTAALISRCRLVLAHRSTAIGYAVKAGKPLMLIALRALYAHSHHKPVFDALSGILNKSVQMFDRAEDVNLVDAFEVDHGAYERYMRAFVKTPRSPDLPFWRIVMDEIDRSGPTRV